MRFFSQKYFFAFLITAQVVLFLFVKDDPFHGDAVTSTARPALHIYEHDLKTIWYPTQHDPGHPTLFPYLLAFLWTVFGKSLWVGHAWVGIISLATLWIFRKLSLQFLTIETANAACLMLALYSIYVSQSALLLNTPLFFLFALWGFYALLNNHATAFMLSSMLMVLTHLQANFMLLSFFVIHSYLYLKQATGKKTLADFCVKSLIWFAPALACFAAWSLLHYKHSGWLVMSPNYTEHESLKSPVQFLQSLFIVLWRLLDYGMVVPYTILIWFALKKHLHKPLWHMYLLLLGVTTICMGIFLYNTIGHRYFLLTQLLAILLLFDALQRHVAKPTLLIVLVCISLLAGNFLFYPGKNLGDGTLLYRSFFSIEKSIKETYSNLKPNSYAPLSSDSEIRYLQKNKGVDFIPLNDEHLDDAGVIIQSNINAEFTKTQKEYLEQNWHGNSYEKGAVYVNVFLNPKQYAKPKDFRLRQPSEFELWLRKVKYRLRGE